MTPASDPRLLRLHPADNVLTVIATLEAGNRIRLENSDYEVPARLPLGHKVAARAIAAGEKVVKYGAPIGSATQPIAAGEHVHTHNLKSDYLATVLREDQARFFAREHEGDLRPNIQHLPLPQSRDRDAPHSRAATSNIQHPIDSAVPQSRDGA